MTEARQTRAENYAVKRTHEFACAACGHAGSVLVVEAADGLEPRCELHIEGLSIRPHQWDEAARVEAELAARERR